jgi:hypothetical protein
MYNLREHIKRRSLIKDAEVLLGGKSDRTPDSKFDVKQLRLGVKEESEHTKNKALQKEIAKDHLAETPNYYTKLRSAGL